MNYYTHLPQSQTCRTCGSSEEGRPHPAKQRLAKRCAEQGHRSRPRYRAGLTMPTHVLKEAIALGWDV